ncbi:MAG: AAA family ATPase, partial [Thiohalocapsa sp.]
MSRILICWLGRADLRAATEQNEVGIGPIAQALATGRFARVELLCDYPPPAAEPYLDWLRARTNAPIQPHPVTLPSPTDFEAIYRHARARTDQILADGSITPEHRTFPLSPGTPAMAAVWIILAKTRVPAELIESSIKHGVQTVSIPFQLSADFLPDLLRRPDAELTRL